MRGRINPEHICKTSVENKSILSFINSDHLPVRHFFYELETNLGFSDPSQSPEETRAPQHQAASSTLKKNLSKLLKYIFSPSKKQTGVGFLWYKDIYLPFTSWSSIGRDNIDLTYETCLHNHLHGR